MKITDVITIDDEILSGTPVFTGTRVPIQTLFWHIEEGITIDEFLQDFPSVSKEQVKNLLKLTNNFISKPQFFQLYETIA
jgi:uncharacterized protein (DUF433 family)